MAYVHFLFAPIFENGDRLCRAEALHDLASSTFGSVLYVSTASRNLSEYKAYVSEGDYGMGPLYQTWIPYGTADDVRLVWSNWVTLESMGHLCGPTYTEGYAFADGVGTVDLYVRSSFTRPTSRFAHYRLDVRDPGSWMEAASYRFLGRIDAGL